MRHVRRLVTTKWTGLSRFSFVSLSLSRSHSFRFFLSLSEWTVNLVARQGAKRANVHLDSSQFPWFFPSGNQGHTKWKRGEQRRRGEERREEEEEEEDEEEEREREHTCTGRRRVEVTSGHSDLAECAPQVRSVCRSRRFLVKRLLIHRESRGETNSLPCWVHSSIFPVHRAIRLEQVINHFSNVTTLVSWVIQYPFFTTSVSSFLLCSSIVLVSPGDAHSLIARDTERERERSEHKSTHSYSHTGRGRERKREGIFCLLTSGQQEHSMQQLTVHV